MTNFTYHAELTRGNGVETVVAFNPESATPIYTADEHHPNWDEIIEGLTVGDPEVWDLFDVAGGVMRRFQQVTDRVSWDGQNVLWDGDPIHSTLAEQFERALRHGDKEDYVALANFWEKLESNPNQHSREQAYNWLASHKFQITPEGDVVAHKGVQRTDRGYESVRASEKPDVPSAFVDGKPVPPLSRVPNNVGTVVSMPRSEVKHDPRRTCERGLHVSTHDYARTWGQNGTRLEVHVNPRDIVSVPDGAGGKKIRVCRYYVASAVGDNYEPTDRPVSRPGQHSWAGDVSYRV